MLKCPTFEEFNNAVDRLLNSPKYAKISDLIINLFERIINALLSFFENRSIDFNDPRKTNVQIIFIIIVGVISLLIVMLIIRSIRRRGKQKNLDTILGESINEASSVINFREKGELLRLEGRFREAVRMQFIAILFHLHEKDILYHDKTMTGKEMINLLTQKDFNGISSFTLLVQRFNYIWYGMEEINSEDYEEWKNIEILFWQEVQR